MPPEGSDLIFDHRHNAAFRARSAGAFLPGSYAMWAPRPWMFLPGARKVSQVQVPLDSGSPGSPALAWSKSSTSSSGTMLAPSLRQNSKWRWPRFRQPQPGGTYQDIGSCAAGHESGLLVNGFRTYYLRELEIDERSSNDLTAYSRSYLAGDVGIRLVPGVSGAWWRVVAGYRVRLGR